MKYLSNRTLSLEEKKWEVKKGQLERLYQLQAEKKAIKRKFLGKMSTSKLLIAFLFANCTAIEIFTAWTTVQSFKLANELMITPDFTPLVTLIGAVVGEVIGYAVYAAKATKENTVGGIIYEREMHSNNDNSVG